MDATTMAAINSLVNTLQKDFPSISFTSSGLFRWSPQDSTVYVGEVATERDGATLLHELGHALEQHTGYDKDIELLRLERQAWEQARKFAPKYGIAIDDDLVEEALDTYRDWLHARSLCPRCSQTGLQTADATYRCLLCTTQWRVNDARQCGLKRYIAPIKKPLE